MVKQPYMIYLCYFKVYSKEKLSYSVWTHCLLLLYLKSNHQAAKKVIHMCVNFSFHFISHRDTLTFAAYNLNTRVNMS